MILRIFHHFLDSLRTTLFPKAWEVSSLTVRQAKTWLRKFDDAFEKEYRQQFAREVPGMTIEILNWSVSVSTLEANAANLVALDYHRLIKPETYHNITCDLTGKPQHAGLLKRQTLEPGDRVTGPALIVEPQTTTLVSADFIADVLIDGSLLLSKLDNTEAEG